MDGPDVPPGGDAHLQGTVNLAAVEHEVEEGQVVHGRLPGHVVPLVLQVGGGPEGQHGADDLGSVVSGERDDGADRGVTAEKTGSVQRDSPGKVEGVVHQLGSVDHRNALKERQRVSQRLGDGVRRPASAPGASPGVSC